VFTGCKNILFAINTKIYDTVTHTLSLLTETEWFATILKKLDNSISL